MKRINAIISSAALAAMLLPLLAGVTGCEKEFKMDLPLAVTARDLTLSKDAGSTHMLVYSDGNWKAHLGEDVEWASLDRKSGYGNSELVFSYSANYGISRKVAIILEKGALADTVTMTQQGTLNEPSLYFSNPEATLLKAPARVTAPVSTDLIYMTDAFRTKAVYYNDEGDEIEVSAPWISDITVSKSEVTYVVSENTSGANRNAQIVLSVMDAEDKEFTAALKIAQTTDEPVLELASEADVYAGNSQNCVVAAPRNNISSYSADIAYDVKYADEPEAGSAEWVDGVRLTSEGLQFTLGKNEGDAQRKAEISLSFADSLGNKVSAVYGITQNAYPKEMTMAELRALTPGLLDSPKYIEGFVTSEAGGKNTASNPQRAKYKFRTDYSDMVAYIQDMDGKYGLKLVFNTADDNTLTRYSRVRIALAGATLEKHSNPDYYILSGLTKENVIEEDTEADALKVEKSILKKHISELTDDDIFTLRDLQDVEIMMKDGCYTNCSDGYSKKSDHNAVGTSKPRWDVAPLLCYDKSGASIHMLFNESVPWRRTGADVKFNTVVPQGSGTLRAIIDCDDIVTVRFGNLGRYQVRAMKESDIALDKPAFSTTIVEWNWNNRKSDVVPETGNGTLSYYAATMGMTFDFNNPAALKSSSNGTKGTVNSGALKLTQKWWDFTAKEGKYFDVSFSTQGISGSNLMFGIVWGHGTMSAATVSGPAHWKMLYSIDGGTTFKEVNPGDIIKNRSVVWWQSPDTSQDSCPGYTEHLRRLPNECFGRDKVVVRLQVADTVTDIAPKGSDWKTNLGIEKGTITESTSAASQVVSIGAITVRYNQ